MTRTDLKNHVADALREYRSSRRDNALTYIKMSRRFAKSPGISRTKALELAAQNFPGSHADFIRRQNAGERLPLLFERESESYATRRATALARGGVIG